MNVFKTLLGWFALAAVACTTASACGNTAAPKKGWVLPSGSKYITSRSPFQFHASGISSPIEAESIHYGEDKYIFLAPSGAKEWWEIRDAVVLKQDGKPFAILARIHYPILDKRGRVVTSLACLTDLAFYDEDGDGSFETITNSRDSSFRITVHLPDWVAERRKQRGIVE